MVGLRSDYPYLYVPLLLVACVSAFQVRSSSGSKKGPFIIARSRPEV